MMCRATSWTITRLSKQTSILPKTLFPFLDLSSHCSLGLTCYTLLYSSGLPSVEGNIEHVQPSAWRKLITFPLNSTLCNIRRFMEYATVFKLKCADTTYE